MAKTILEIVIALAVLLACFFGGCIVERHRNAASQIVTTDTLIVHDTLRITKVKEVERKVTEQVYFAVHDTIHHHDTTYVVLNKEVKTYLDSLFKAQISGIEPQLDWIEIYPQTKYIITTIKEKPHRWGISLQAGYGLSKQGLSPYIGIGVSYNLWSF